MVTNSDPPEVPETVELCKVITDEPQGGNIPVLPTIPEESL